ncbi:MAG TPA: hypothetical protein PKC72_14335 [Chitinophagaceae bacterium]|nr:hypothetical protein [Chitinophagaceae bacterium]
MDDSHSVDKMNEELAKLIRQSIKSLKTYLPPLQKEVDNIIDQKNIDIKIIEHLLDSLSSLLYAGIGHQLYLKLLEYYKIVDKDGADFYWKLYEEIGDG